MACLLLPYSFPIVPRQDEVDIACLKQREITIDGYDVGVYFNSCDYSSYKLESLQVFGRYFNSLPFYLVCKIARAFLGSEDLTLIESIDKSYRKIYVWTLYYDRDGKKTSSPVKGKRKADYFEGFNFFRLNEMDIKFF